MALEGLSQRNGFFGEEDFRRHGLEPSQLEPGLVQRAAGKEGAFYTFRLPVLQEFVAALAQYLAPERRNLLELLRATQAADDGRYQGYLRFLLGLSARASSRQLEELLLPLPHRSICEAIFWLEALVQVEVKKRELNRRRLLGVAHYLQEGRNRRLARLLGRSISQMALGSERSQHGVRLDPSDCAALCYVFQHSESIDTFSFENCYMQAEGIKHLLAAFLNCKRLRLAKNNLTRACIADLLSAIGQNVSIVGLSLNRNNLGDIGVQQLAEGLQFPGCNIEVLQLDGNRLTEACAQGLSNLLESLHKLSWLILDRNQLGDAGLRKLSIGIRKSKIRKLGMGFNGLTDLAAEYFLASLCVTHSIQFLYLTGNYFTDKSVTSFTTLIWNLPRLRRLWLGKNTLSEEGKQLLLDVQARKPELKVLL
ncbi:NACHT, LRR and PYD domains-containing protein 3-like isoform X2 [Scyliorhinus torazame]|uniref:NACHT, LRR and PYD domains-containing protein 3-like isoform X2 n=1 Tax=Scyliorhinus torazame TaxID=75743 RepID=UPI003B5AA278